MRVIAIAGSLITVTGVGLVVALAIQSGLLGPLGRVLLSALLAVLLLAGGLWLDRRGGAAAGVNALVVTSYLITIVIIVAIVHVLEWWPEWAGTLALLAAWFGYLGLARVRGMWVVALCLGISWLPLSMYVSSSPSTWVLVVLPLTLLAATWGSRRVEVRITAGVIAVVLMLQYIGDPGTGTALREIVAVLGMVSSLAFAAVSLRDPRPNPVQTYLGAYLPVILLLLAVPSASDSYTLWLLLPTTVALGALGHVHRTSGGTAASEIAEPLELTGLCGTAVAFLFIWWLSPPMGAGERVDATIVVALFFIAAVLMFHWLRTNDSFGATPWLVWWVVAIVVTWNLARSVLLQTPVWLTDNIALVQAALIAVFLAFTYRFRGALEGFVPWVQVVFAVAALYLSMVSLVTAVTWLGALIGGNTGMWVGYLIGHAGVSVLWMVLAAWVLLAPARLTDRSNLWAGVLLAGAGTAKLVFFDLGTLEGLPRAVAFLLSGLALLAMASLRTRRARQADQSISDRN